MPTIRTGDNKWETIDAGNRIEVTATATAMVGIFGQGAGSALIRNVSLSAGESYTFGPYFKPVRLQISALTGNVEYNEFEGDPAGEDAQPLAMQNGALTGPSLAAVLAAAGEGGGIVSITGNTTLTIADHNGKTLRCSGSQTLTVPEDLGTEFSCIVEMVAAATVSFDPTGSTAIQDSATPAGNTTTRTRSHSNNPSGVVLKSTATANTLSLSGV